MEVIGASAGTLLVVAGYALVKRFQRSNCKSKTGCCEIDSPAVELAKQQTERLESQSEQLKNIMKLLREGQALPTALPLKGGVTETVATTATERSRSNSASYLSNSPRVPVENRPSRGNTL